jgi:hypothetical protein
MLGANFLDQPGLRRRPLLAEAVEELQAGSQARNNGIGIARRVNHYCPCGWLAESLLRWPGKKIVLQQPQPTAAILIRIGNTTRHMVDAFATVNPEILRGSSHGNDPRRDRPGWRDRCVDGLRPA